MASVFAAVVAQLLRSCPTLCEPGICPPVSPRVCSNSGLVMLSNHFILRCPLFLLLLFYVLCFFFGHTACGILALQPGIEPTQPASEDEVLTTETLGKSLYVFTTAIFQCPEERLAQSRSSMLRYMNEMKWNKHAFVCPYSHVVWWH